MAPHSYIITNFAYGTGPYVRTTELALAVNDELERLGHPRSSIVVPLIYGEKQKRIMQEEFSLLFAKHPKEIILDETFGSHLKKTFYIGTDTYETHLNAWAKNAEDASKKLEKHIQDTYGNRIAMILQRSPRVRINIAPSYFASFGYLSDIYERSIDNTDIAIRKETLLHAAEYASSIEKEHLMHIISTPGTFSWKHYSKKYADEILSPPLISPYTHTEAPVEKGIFVNVTGIPGLAGLYKAALEMETHIYTNDTTTLPQGTKTPSSVMFSGNILFQFARTGWSSVWLSHLSGTPLVYPQWKHTDDPEIYFNNICVKTLGLGIPYEGQHIDSLIKTTETLRATIKSYNAKILDTFGTTNGTHYAAKKIAEHFAKNHLSL